MQPSPVEQQVGIDAGILRDGRHRRARHQASFDEGLLECVGVPTPGVLGLGDSLSVHDVHLPVTCTPTSGARITESCSLRDGRAMRY